MNYFDTEIRTNVQEGMVKHGIEFLTESSIEQIEKTPEGLKLTLSGKSEGTLIVDALLSATGRLPNLEKLGLENAGVETDKGAIAVTKDSAPASRTFLQSEMHQPHQFNANCDHRKAVLLPILNLATIREQSLTKMSLSGIFPRRSGYSRLK